MSKLPNPYYLPKEQAHQYFNLRDTLHDYLKDNRLSRQEKFHLRALVGDFQDDQLTDRINKSIRTRTSWRVDNVRVSNAYNYKEIQAMIDFGQPVLAGRLQVERTPLIESDRVYEVLGAVNNEVWVRNTSGFDNVLPGAESSLTGRPDDGIIRMSASDYQRQFNFQF